MATRPADPQGVFPQPLPEQARAFSPAQQPVPETGFMENLSAGFEEMRIAGNTYAEDNRLSAGYTDLINRVNVDLPAEQQFSDLTRRMSIYPWEYEQRIFDVIAERRRRDPNYLPGIPSTAFEYREQLRQGAVARLQELRRIQQGATGMGQAGGVLGSIGGGLTDSVNIFTLPFGGTSRTVLGSIAREGIENAIVETALLPQTNMNYAQLGEEQTTGDNIRQVLFALGGGSAFRGAQIGVSRGAGALYDRILPPLFNALPESVQQRWAGAATINDIPLTDILRATVPPETWTPQLRASVNVAEREGEVANASPFEPTPAGDAAHAENLTQALQQLVDGARPAEIVSRGTSEEAPAFRPAPSPPVNLPARGAQGFSQTPFSAVRQRIIANEAGPSVGGYDALAYNTAPGRNAAGVVPPRPITQMTIGEVYDFQRGPMRERTRGRRGANDVGSTGVGAYQFESQTLRQNAEIAFGADWRNQRFTPEVQDRIAETLWNRVRGNPELLGNTWAAFSGGTPREGGDIPAAPERTAIASDGSAAQIADLEAQLAMRDSETAIPPARDFEEGVSAFDQPPVLRRDLFASDREWEAAQRELGGEVRIGARDDVRTVLADAGGISDGEGHNLIRGRNLQRFVPGSGPLIRKNGITIDEAGEYLWGRGFFGPPETSPRPTTAQVLDLVERSANERVYTPEMTADALAQRQRERAVPEEDIWNQATAEIRASFGEDVDLLDTPEMRRLVAQYRGGGEYDGWGAYERALDDLSLEYVMQARGVTGDTSYDITSFNVEDFAPNRIGREADASGGRSASAPGNAGEGGTAIASAARRSTLNQLLASSAALDAPMLREFDIPNGEPSRGVADSLQHDLKASIAENPAVAAQKFLLDEAGKEMTLDAIMEELDADRAAVAAIRGCL